MTQTFTRSAGRAANQLRPVRITRGFTVHAEGSVLIEFGATRVLCTASVEERVPPHKRGSGEGWVTAEYGMLPRATHTRGDREAAKGKQSGRIDETLAAAAAHFEEELRVRIKRLTIMLEPVLTLTISALVLGVALAIFLPMWQMNRMLLKH